MIVNARPFPNYKVLLSKNCDNSIFLNGSLEFYKMGRDALIQALLQLKVNKNDLIVVPGYICKSTLGPIINAGFRIKFIDINSDFGFNKSELINLFDNESVGAVIPVHYFGFPAPDLDFIHKVCKENNVPMIEDCCHQFLTKVNNNYLGLIGEAAIYSMRKTLPIIDGGALKIKSKTLKTSKDKPNWKIQDFCYLLKRYVEKCITLIGWPNIYSKKIKSLKSFSTNSNGNKKSTNSYSNGPSKMLWSYLSNLNYINEIEIINRKNYFNLSERLRSLDLKIMHVHLPEGVVPHVLSIWDKSNSLLEFLNMKGIAASQWPGKELPEEVLNNYTSFKITNSYNNEWVHLPINQSLSEKQSDYIFNNVLKWKSNFISNVIDI